MRIGACWFAVAASAHPLRLTRCPEFAPLFVTIPNSARQGVEHDDMNILCMGARVIGPMVGSEHAIVFADAEFTGEERHVRRLRKVEALEARRWK